MQAREVGMMMERIEAYPLQKALLGEQRQTLSAKTNGFRPEVEGCPYLPHQPRRHPGFLACRPQDVPVLLAGQWGPIIPYRIRRKRLLLGSLRHHPLALLPFPVQDTRILYLQDRPGIMLRSSSTIPWIHILTRRHLRHLLPRYPSGS